MGSRRVLCSRRHLHQTSLSTDSLEPLKQQGDPPPWHPLRSSAHRPHRAGAPLKFTASTNSGGDLGRCRTSDCEGSYVPDVPSDPVEDDLRARLLRELWERIRTSALDDVHAIRATPAAARAIDADPIRWTLPQP